MSPQRPQSCEQSLCHRPSSQRLCQVSRDLPHLPFGGEVSHPGTKVYPSFLVETRTLRHLLVVSSWGHSVTITLSLPCSILPPHGGPGDIRRS